MAMSKREIASQPKQDGITNLTNALESLGAAQGLNTVFCTFLELMATGLAMELDPIHATEREKRYDALTSGLTTELAAEYAKLYGLMNLAVQEHKDEPRDILGEVFHRLNLQNEWHGQFFTPDDVSRLMALLCGIGNMAERHDKPKIMLEPACGVGGMVIAGMWALKQKGVEHPNNILYIAQDIDIRCVWMSYIQFCLYEIPACVVHGNSLTDECWGEWLTPWFLRSYKAYEQSKTE